MTVFLYCGATISRLKRLKILSGQVALKIILAKTVIFKISMQLSLFLQCHWHLVIQFNDYLDIEEPIVAGILDGVCSWSSLRNLWKNPESLPEEASQSQKKCSRQSWLPDFRFLLNRRRTMRLWSNDAIWLARRTEKHSPDATHATCLFYWSSAAQYTCDWWTQE